MKSAKKGNSAVVFAGFGVLILLVVIAGWLTIRMLDLSKGLDQISGDRHYVRSTSHQTNP